MPLPFPHLPAVPFPGTGVTGGLGVGDRRDDLILCHAAARVSPSSCLLSFFLSFAASYPSLLSSPTGSFRLFPPNIQGLYSFSHGGWTCGVPCLFHVLCLLLFVVCIIAFCLYVYNVHK